MIEQNERLVREAYEAQARGDLEVYLGLLAEDFVLHIPGRSRIAGEYRGHEEVRRHFREIAQLSGGSFRTVVHDVVSSREHVVGLVVATAERDGREFELPRVHIWHTSGGQLSEMWLLPADQYEFDSFWGSGPT
jgi:uncharacterized protein